MESMKGKMATQEETILLRAERDQLLRENCSLRAKLDYEFPLLRMERDQLFRDFHNLKSQTEKELFLLRSEREQLLDAVCSEKSATESLTYKGKDLSLKVENPAPLYMEELQVSRGLIDYYKLKEKESLEAIDRLNAELRDRDRVTHSNSFCQHHVLDVLGDKAPKSHEHLFAYTIARLKHTSLHRLVLSKNLQDTIYFEYCVPYKVNSIKSIELAIRKFTAAPKGMIGIEIVTSDNKIIAHNYRPASDIPENGCTLFSLNSPLTLQKNWRLRNLLT